ncbi:putative SGNH hydrolase-type esterase domain, SGNH hydrolase superfamily [Septoria linicola]|nr:putative SGNH hydrolase-type esterase domain, SGNH hydrolase superfamily [Septoria linicola]
MKLLNSIAGLAQLRAIYASPLLSRQESKAPFFLLAGDSTTAIGGGWGDGFLETTLAPPAAGINYGHSGATTVSFRAGGDWPTLLSEIPSHTSTTSQVYVTISFGHNDQKATANISLARYSSNLSTFISDVRALGAEPILVSSLTRRVFSGSPPKVVQSLANEREVVMKLAESKEVKWVDLNIASEEYCNKIGPGASYGYNLFNATRQGDTTHLNEWGGVVFGRLVSDLLVEKYPEEFEEWTVRNETLSQLLKDGVAA